MGVNAIALLKIPGLTPPEDSSMRLVRLDDAVLLHTGERFSLEPEELASVVFDELGAAAMAEHVDPRGIFFLPDVAASQAGSYEAVIAEVADGGLWAQPANLLEAFGPADGLGALGAVLSSVIQYMPEAMVDAASAAAKGDEAGFRAVGEQVAALMGQSDSPLAGFAKLIDGAGLDLSSPGFQQLLIKVQEQLARDPETVQRVSEQLFGGRDPSVEDDDE